MTKLYSIEAVDNFVHLAYEKNWQVEHLCDGVVTDGDWLLVDYDNLTAYLIQDKPLNEWQSAYTCKSYNITSERSMNKLLSKDLAGYDTIESYGYDYETHEISIEYKETSYA